MKKHLLNRSDKNEIILLLTIAFLINQTVYFGSKKIAQSWYHYDMTTSFDVFIPFLPWTISVYWGCYLFWCINYFLCAAQKNPKRDRFFCADALSKGVCFLLYLLIPTTNIRPIVTGDTLWDVLIRLLYHIDTADNLFPSIHCLVSWFCWIGVRQRTDLSFIYRFFSLAMAIAVCISTLTTRQHVIIDVIGSIFLAEISYYVAGKTRIRNIYSAGISRVYKLLQ